MRDGSRERGKEGPPSQSSPQMGEEARRGWVPAPYQVRGRLFAGTTIGGTTIKSAAGFWSGGALVLVDGFPPRIEYGAGFSRE